MYNEEHPVEKPIKYLRSVRLAMPASVVMGTLGISPFIRLELAAAAAATAAAEDVVAAAAAAAAAMADGPFMPCTPRPAPRLP